MGRAMEQLRGGKGTDESSSLRPPMLDDRIGESGYAQVYLEAGVVGCKAQDKSAIQ